MTDCSDGDNTRAIADALCAADSILSLLHYRYRLELGEQNAKDVEAAATKLAALRTWYEPIVRGVTISGSDKIKPRHYTDEDHQAWSDHD